MSHVIYVTESRCTLCAVPNVLLNFPPLCLQLNFNSAPWLQSQHPLLSHRAKSGPTPISTYLTASLSMRRRIRKKIGTLNSASAGPEVQARKPPHPAQFSNQKHQSSYPCSRLSYGPRSGQATTTRRTKKVFLQSRLPLLSRRPSFRRMPPKHPHSQLKKISKMHLT